MSARRVYKCDVCRDEIKGIERCYGVNFSGMKKFKLDDPMTTDGVHICFSCLQQLEVQIPETQASVTYSPDNTVVKP
jgi:hypothetical protein